MVYIRSTKYVLSLGRTQRCCGATAVIIGGKGELMTWGILKGIYSSWESIHKYSYHSVPAASTPAGSPSSRRSSSPPWSVDPSPCCCFCCCCCIPWILMDFHHAWMIYLHGGSPVENSMEIHGFLDWISMDSIGISLHGNSSKSMETYESKDLFLEIVGNP